MLYYIINGGFMDNEWINEQAEAYGMTPQQFVAWLIATGHVG